MTIELAALETATLEGIVGIDVSADHWLPRRCVREPIAAIYEAAALLDRATGAHLAGDRQAAEALIHRADMPEIRLYTETLWGSAKIYPEQHGFVRFRAIEGSPRSLPKALRHPLRMPNKLEQAQLIERYGRNCAFCGMPLIRAEVRTAFCRAYPAAAYWRAGNINQHAAFQCLWLQFDHVLPHSRGGQSSIDNVVITCAPCNYSRGEHTLEELGLVDPRSMRVHKTSWDGLERFLAGPIGA